MTFLLRKVFIAISFFIVLAIALPQVPSISAVVDPIIGIEDASAQAKKKKRKSLFDILFKKRKTRKKKGIKTITTRKKATAAKKRTTQKKTRKNKRVANVAPRVKIVKNENAAKILVIGDYIGGDLARGMIVRYAENPNVSIIRETKDASGLIREDVTNWSELLPELIEKHKPAAITVLIGMNDRQKMRIEGQWTERLTEEWVAEYNARIQKIIDVSKTSNLPLVWVGAPPVPFRKMNPDYLAMNEIYRTKIEAAEYSYVDIWDGYTNAEGKYVRAGPDVNGQIVRLRTQKGVSMTRAGRAKLAYFADIAFRKLGVVQDPSAQLFASLGTINLGSAQPAAPEYDPVGTGKTNVIPLGSPLSDGGLKLEGEKNFITDEENKKSVSYELVNHGVVTKPQLGRIDANWGEPTPAIKKEDEKKLETKEPAENQQQSSINAPTQTVAAN